MKFNVDEMMKLFDFLLENREIVISDDSLFTIDTLREIRMIAKQKIPNNFILKNEQKELLIKVFIDKKLTFNDETPSFMIENEKCIISAIKNNINSIDYLNNVSEKILKIIEKECIRQKYIISASSLYFATINYNIIQNSLKLDVFSSDYVNWYKLNERDAESLIKIISNSKYVISDKTPGYLLDKKEIILLSIKNDNNINIKLIPYNLRKDIDIIKTLILNNCQIDEKSLEILTLNELCDDTILDFILNKFDYYPENIPSNLKVKFRKLIIDSLKSKPKISDFKKIFSVVSENEWKQNKQRKTNEYQNLFGRICWALREKETFDEALKELILLNLNDMKEKLGDKFNLLYEAMESYYDIYHNDYNNKLGKIKLSQDTISKYSSKYIAICKESFKKNKYMELITDFFKLKLDNPEIKKRIIFEKKREKFANLFNSNDEEIKKFIFSIIDKYSKDYDPDLVETIVIPLAKYDKEEMFYLYEPATYSSYLVYEKIKRLIKRLNLGYITIEGKEVHNYVKFIKYDNETKQYIYNGKNFDYDEFLRCADYKKNLFLCNKIQREIMLKIKEIEVDEHITSEDLHNYIFNLEFNDINYEFDLKKALSKQYNILNHCLFSSALGYQYHKEVFEDDEVYSYVYNLLVSSGLSWVLILLRDHSLGQDFNRCGLSSFKIFNLINGMKKMLTMAKNFKIDILDISNLLKFSEIINYLNDEIISILSPELIVKLCTKRSFVEKDETEVLSIAVDLICNMSKRSKSTVPYIEGEYLNYKYSMYDSLDEDVLATGLDTDSCFKIGGNDNDFLHYCALNKNGFIMKITDINDNLVARASGFRNGNAVYINQLRTIYDMGNIRASSKFCCDKSGIIKVFNKACFDIINISQNNKEEENKIDFIFVTKSYLLDHITNNVTGEVEEFIGECPVDNKSSDWKEYVKITPNLYFDNSFSTDYGAYPLICVIASKNIEDIKVIDFKHGDVPASYKRKRNQIKVYENINLECLTKVRKIKAIACHLKNKTYNYVNIPDDSVIFVGDNWYIVLNNNEIIDKCVIEDDRNAKREYNATMEVIKNKSILLEDENKILSLVKNKL